MADFLRPDTVVEAAFHAQSAPSDDIISRFPIKMLQDGNKQSVEGETKPNQAIPYPCSSLLQSLSKLSVFLSSLSDRYARQLFVRHWRFNLTKDTLAGLSSCLFHNRPILWFVKWASPRAHHFPASPPSDMLPSEHSAPSYLLILLLPRAGYGGIHCPVHDSCMLHPGKDWSIQCWEALRLCFTFHLLGRE